MASACPVVDSSNPGLLEPMASVTQLAKMTVSINQSKTLIRMSLISGLRTRLSFFRTKRAVGASAYELTTCKVPMLNTRPNPSTLDEPQAGAPPTDGTWPHP